ncbi:hypothetical protein [Brumimicrobium aurantiacum]|uniref:Uncharacterized protein n=1 Tax=Brumimicrobium aurantiacum TaxID=1737063 RepID=A0A3E1EWB6_9FLAO|nr:hypothetical protein [Brumimicrobium aurantiacum]RFC53812.1 hypothetical protein DXU93_11840 [Brumimicrobium aurantiacum]
MKEDNKNQASINAEKKKPFWKKHFLSLFLLLLLIVSVAWGYFQNRATVSKYEKDITEINVSHEKQLKSLEAKHLQQLVSTLALAVRSEMINENMNQVNQYFIQSLKNVDVSRLILVDHTTGKAILSTNKKDEEAVFSKTELVNAKNPMTKVYDNSTYAATPIMGLNAQLGVLIMQVN